MAVSDRGDPDAPDGAQAGRLVAAGIRILGRAHHIEPIPDLTCTRYFPVAPIHQ